MDKDYSYLRAVNTGPGCKHTAEEREKIDKCRIVRKERRKRKKIKKV